MDIGTYHVKVEFDTLPGFIYKWSTGLRFTGGDNDVSPLDAMVIESPWVHQIEIVDAIVYQFTKGNYSCDCNRRMFSDRAYHRELDNYECGNEVNLTRLTLIRPNGTELIIYQGI